MYENIPDDHTAREEKQIGYYQWVPFILIAEALMFSLPCIFWRLLSWQSGLNIQHLINSACDTQALVDPSERNKAVEAISSCFIDNLDLQSPTGQEKSLLAYIKFFMIYGKASLGQNLDIFLESLFAILKYTVQCCLLINIINEKVFAFLWCWYLLLGAITTCSTIFWIMSMFIPSEKADYVLKFMQIAHSSDMKRSEKFKKVSLSIWGNCKFFNLGTTNGTRLYSNSICTTFARAIRWKFLEVRRGRFLLSFL
ncbi:hypothetical protein WR25_06775 isoform E [Diploscapter pachys]|uniref:Innexin n=1 Tax=Diploscapter pachys TaxID=2018661 RepID=A0A2A2J4N8_9BILA|nr:hypothetical protein WR25_06775 isoform D [Diploscapter pachys]PAV56452.1 hypothetical protein WR25_06775 isoform E [Diploscapter pachys]